MAILHLKEVDSTNTYLKNLLLDKGIEEGTLVYADFQTGGKGQRGNRWESEKGKNLMFSIVLYPDTIGANEQFVISQIVSLAIAEHLGRYAEDVTIKWPNDIYWKEEKICGILIENTLVEDKISQSVIGIGINVNQTKFVTNAPNPVSLKLITGQYYDLETMLEAIRDNILAYYLKLKEGDTEQIALQYKNLLFRRDGYSLYNDGSIDFSAKIKDVEPNGMLVLETENGETKRFAFKEVKYILNT